MEEPDKIGDGVAQQPHAVFVFDRLRQIERVEVDVGIERHLEKRPAHRLAQMFVLVFRINDDDARSEHHSPEHFQLHSIALARSGFGEHHHIGVFHFEAIEEYQAVVVAVDAVEDAFVGREVGRDEGERGRERLRIQIVGDIQSVIPERPGRRKTLIHPHYRRLGIDELSLENGFYRLTLFVQILVVLPIDGHIEAEAEKFFRALLQVVAQAFDVFQRGFQYGIAHLPAFRFDADLRLHLRRRLAERLQDFRRLYGVHEERDIHRKIDVDDRGKPVGRKKARIGDDEIRARHDLADLHRIGVELDGWRSDQIPDSGDSPLIEHLAGAHFFGTMKNIEHAFLLGSVHSLRLYIDNGNSLCHFC